MKTTYLSLTSISSTCYLEWKAGTCANSVHSNSVHSCLVSLLQSFVNLKELLHLFIYLCMCTGGSGDSLQEAVLSLQHVGPKD